jgi:anti-sigma factor RsiW
MNCNEVKTLLDGYRDGELDLVHSLELEAHLGQCASCSQALRRLEEISGAVAAAPRYAAGRGLRRRVMLPATRHSRQPAVWVALAASLVALALAVWRFMPSPSAASPIEKEIVQNHIRSLLADHLLDMPSSDQHTVQPWFRGRLDYAPVVEDISSHDFALLGGRLDYLDSRPVAALVYQRRQHVVNVFVWPASGEKDRVPASRQVDGFHLVGWRANGMNWWAISDLTAVELEELPLCPCFMLPNSTLHASAAGNTPRNPS